MKKTFTIMASMAFLFIVPIFADLTVIGGNVVGYAKRVLHPGENLISDAFNLQNNLSSSIPSAPIGTTISLWDPLQNTYNESSTYLETGWSVDLIMTPGTGAKLATSSTFTNIWSGEVFNGDGSGWDGSGLVLPPTFDEPNGTYLLGMAVPVGNVEGEDVFLLALGRSPNAGESVTTLESETQLYTTTTYLGSGMWDNGIPDLDVAEAAFFTIPEPSTVGLLGSSTLLLIAFRNRRKLNNRRTRGWSLR